MTAASILGSFRSRVKGWVPLVERPSSGGRFPCRSASTAPAPRPAPASPPRARRARRSRGSRSHGIVPWALTGLVDRIEERLAFRSRGEQVGPPNSGAGSSALCAHPLARTPSPSSLTTSAGDDVTLLPNRHRLTQEYAADHVSDAQKLRVLEDENRRPKELLAKSMLDVAALKDLPGFAKSASVRSIRQGRSNVYHCLGCRFCDRRTEPLAARTDPMVSPMPWHNGDTMVQWIQLVGRSIPVRIDIDRQLREGVMPADALSLARRAVIAATVAAGPWASFPGC